MPCDLELRLPRSARLQRRAEFRRVYDRGARAAGRFMVVFVLRRDATGLPSRVGVTASRRVGGAVVRARCRRRIRELFRLHRGELPGEPIDLVVNARRGCAEAPWDELRQDYVRCVRQVRRRLAS